jgi:hypothetical protein
MTHDPREAPSTAPEGARVEIRGRLSRRLGFTPFRILAIVTGFTLLRGLVSLVGRFLLVWRRTAIATIDGGTLVLDVEWSALGKSFRKRRTVAPIRGVEAARLEERRRYLHLLVGFGCLAIGTWVGIQWFVDGLRAGFPQLALVGAGVVAAGIVLDWASYSFVPEGKGRHHVVLAMGPWRVRLAGVDRGAAERFLAALRDGWSSAPERR